MLVTIEEYLAMNSKVVAIFRNEPSSHVELAKVCAGTCGALGRRLESQAGCRWGAGESGVWTVSGDLASLETMLFLF